MSTSTICLDADVQDRDEQTELQLAALREQTKVNKWKQKWFKVEPGKEEAGMKKSCKIIRISQDSSAINKFYLSLQHVAAKTRTS